jgi:hypothetical protein
MLLHIGLGDIQRLLDRRGDAVAEELVHPVDEEQHRERRNEDRRQQRDQAEPQHETQMQSRAHQAAAALQPKSHQLPGDKGRQQRQQNKIEEQQRRDRCLAAR